MDLAATYWIDQTTDGYAGDLGLEFRDLLYENGTVRLQAFRSRGALQEGYGYRLRLSHYVGQTSWNASYEINRFADENPALAREYGTNQAATASMETMLTDSTDLSVNFDYRFGEGQEAFTLGVFVQTRF